MNPPANSNANSASTPNQTGAEMLQRLDVLDQHLSLPDLTTDASGVLRSKRDELHGRFTKAAEYALALAGDAGVQFPNPLSELAVTSKQTAEQKKPNLWDALTPEQMEHASNTRTALSVEFQRHEGEFDLIKTENPEDPAKAQILLALTATQRLDLGDPALSYDPKRSWNGIMGARNNTKRMVIIDGKKTDVNATQTLAVLNAIAKANPEINEWAWRTGEPERADSDFAPVAGLDGGQANGDQRHRDDDNGAFGFRPAVVIVG